MCPGVKLKEVLGPQTSSGTCVGIFIMGRQKAEYLFVIDGKLSSTMMNKRKWQDQ
jgi:hypothetical protein